MITVDLSRNTITFEGKSVAIWPQCAELAFALAETFPNVVSSANQMRALFGWNEPLHADKSLRACSSRLRCVVASIGLGVATFRTRGRAFYLLRDGLPLGADPNGARRKPDRNRTIIALRREGLTSYEIAAKTNASRNAVCGALRRAKVQEQYG
jgi:hypothetical protein